MYTLAIIHLPRVINETQLIQGCLFAIISTESATTSIIAWQTGSSDGSMG